MHKVKTVSISPPELKTVFFRAEEVHGGVEYGTSFAWVFSSIFSVSHYVLLHTHPHPTLSKLSNFSSILYCPCTSVPLTKAWHAEM